MPKSGNFSPANTGSLSPAATLLGCENFLTATKTKQEIESAISYANASSYVIKVDYPANTGVIKSPAGGEVSKKVTDSFSLSFEAASDYEFLEWSIIDAATNVELEKDKYLVLESMKLSSTTCTFVKEPEPELQLCLYAKVAKRPRIIDETPKNDPAGSFRDARIVVMFDQAMDSSSIYYTADEIQKLKQTQGIGDSAFLKDSTTARVYGYEKDGVQVYKNIQIINYNSEKSLLKYYSAPVFQDPRTLVIATDLDNPPPAGSQVLVTLSRNFSYDKNGKPVTLKEDSTWTYYTNANRDTDAPIVSTCEIRTKKLSTDALQELTDSVSNRPVLYQGNLYFNIEVSDSGSGPAGYFYLNLEKAGQDENPPTYTIKVPFKAVTSNTATYQGKNYAGAGGFVDYDGYVIPDVLDDGTALNDGNYKITTLVFEDRNGRSTTKEINTYFYKDTTPPDLFNPGVGRNTAETPTLKLSFYLKGDNTDIGYVSIKVKESSSAQTWDKITAIEYLPSTHATNQIESVGTQGAKTCTIKNLAYGKTYDIKAVVVDKAGNFVERLFTGIMTRPSAFAEENIQVEVVHTPGQRDRAKITVKNTDANPIGNYSGIYVEIDNSCDAYFYPDPSNTDDGESQQYCEDPNKTYVCYTPYLDFSTEYKINIYKQIGHANGDHSVNYVQKTFKTKPASIASTAKINAVTADTIKLSGIKPTGITGCQVWVKKTSESEDAYTKKATPTATNYTIESLVPGTQYDIKLIPYFGDSDNLGEPCFLSGWTKPPVPRNISVTFTQNAANTGVTAHVTWEAPTTGEYDNYIVWHYANKTQEVVSKNELSYDFNNIAFCKPEYYYVHTSQNQSGETVKSDSVYEHYCTPPKKAVMTSCGFDNTIENAVIKWDLPVTAPYIDDNNSTSDATVYLYYGTSELAVLAGTSSKITLEYNRNVSTSLQHGSTVTTITFTPKDVTIPMSSFTSGQTYYFAIKTKLSDSEYGGAYSWSDLQELFVPLPVPPPTNVNCLNDKGWTSDTTARITWTNPSGNKWEKINLYANGSYAGSVNKSDNVTAFTFTNLTGNTEYVLSARAERSGSESAEASVTITTDKPYPNLNFAIVGTNGSGQNPVLQWASLKGKTVGDYEIQRIQVRYILAYTDSTNWIYCDEGTSVQNYPTCYSHGWEGGDKPETTIKELRNLNRGQRYIIKFDTYGREGSFLSGYEEIRLTTNTIEYTVP